jgi:hypothetical protein
VETKYLLRTADEPPAFIAVETSGWRTGPREVMERLQDPERANGVDPCEYSFKLSIKLETGDVRYRDRLNGGLWIGSGARTGDEGTLSVWSETASSLTLCSDLRHLSCGVNNASRQETNDQAAPCKSRTFLRKDRTSLAAHPHFLRDKISMVPTHGFSRTCTITQATLFNHCASQVTNLRRTRCYKPQSIQCITTRSFPGAG